jgi:ribosomal protein S18 acetylase RimI-like enzyme
VPLLEDLPGRARFHAWGAEIDGRLAGVGLLYQSARGAYLAGGVTAPEHRQRGVQRALLQARWQHALGLGARLVVSETGEEKPGQEQHSYRNLCRLGLAPVGTRPNYRWRAPVVGG